MCLMLGVIGCPSSGPTKQGYLALERRRSILDMLKITAWLDVENVETIDVTELEEQVYDQAHFATSWEDEVWLFN